MIRPLALLAMAACALPAAAQPAGESARDASYIPDDAPSWTSMEDAIGDAQADSQLVLVHVYAKWCGWCRRLDMETYTDDAVQEYLDDHFEVTRIDTESADSVTFFGRTLTQAELAEGMGVSSTPGTVFVRHDGTLLTHFPGWAPPDRFLYVLRYVQEGVYERMPFQTFVEQEEAANTPLIPTENGG